MAGMGQIGRWARCWGQSLAVSIPLVVAAGTAQAQLDHQFVWKGGNWNGYVWTDRETGAFSQCTVQVGSYHFVDLVLSFGHEFGFSITLVSDRWGLNVGESGTATYRLGRNRPRFARVHAHQTNAVRMDLPDDPNLVDRFRRARQIQVSSFVGDFTFGLSGSNRAIRWLRGCFNARMNAQQIARLRGGGQQGGRGDEARREPQTPTEAAPDTPAPQAQTARLAQQPAPEALVATKGVAPPEGTAEGTRIAPARAAMVLASALSKAAGAPFDMSPREEPNTIGFSTDSLFGGLELLPKSFDQLMALRGELIGNAAANCSGAFSTRNGPVSDTIDMSMTMSCETGGATLATRYALMRSDAGYALLSLQGTPEDVAAMGDTLLDEISRRAEDFAGPSL
ncbi:MAG: hypothetical protein AAGF45_07345 [Pseudomonadota bacterium]